MTNDDFRVNNLKKMMRRKRFPLGDELIQAVADWNEWMKDNDIGIVGESKWYVKFLKWAIQERCDEFVSFCQNTSNEKATEILLSLKRIYEKRPYKNICGVATAYNESWGWLHAELTQSINFRFFISKVEEAKRLANQRRIDPEPYEIEWREGALEELMLSTQKNDIQDNSYEDDNNQHARLPKETLDSLWSLAQEKHEEDQFCFDDKVLFCCHVIDEDYFDVDRILEEHMELLEKYVTEETWEKMADESPELSKEDEVIIKKIYKRCLLEGQLNFDDMAFPQYSLSWIEDEKGNRAVIMTSTTGWLYSTETELVGIYSSREEAMKHLRSWGTLVE